MTRGRPDAVLSTDVGLTVLLGSLFVALFVIYPFAPLSGLGQLMVHLSLSVILVAGTLSLADRPHLRLCAFVLAGIALAATWLGHLFGTVGVRIWFHAAMILFLALTAGGTIAKVLRAGRITLRRRQGAVAVYLMLGLIRTFGYSLVELLDPGSFHLPPAMAEETAIADGEVFVYFSFVTLTSLGYGDVTPASPAVRILAILEALVGQLYVAMLIARLVGLRIAQPQDEAR